MIVFAAQAKPITSHKPIPGLPSLLTPVQMDWLPMLMKSEKLVSRVCPMTELASAGKRASAPLMNMTINHGPQIPENSATALKPYIATRTTIIPTPRTTKTNRPSVGYHCNWAGMLNSNRTAVQETVIIAAEMTVKISTLAAL